MSDPAALFAQASACVRAGRQDQAEGLLRQLLAQQSRHAPAWHLLGLVAHQSGRLAAALDCFQRAVGLEAANAQYHTCLGAAYHALGQHVQAVACQRQALALSPADPQALNNLGVALMALGQSEEALAAFRQTLAVAPNDPAALCNLAAALVAHKQYPEAIPLYRQAVALCPQLAQAHNNLGNALLATGQYGEAEASYRRALELAPRFALAHANLGRLHHRRGRTNEAVASYRQALQLQPHDAGTAKQLARALLDGNHTTEALAACQDALHLRPDDAETWNDLGNVCYARGELDDADAHYQRAITLQPRWSMPRYNRGLALQSQGKLVAARTSFTEALELNPDDAVAHSTWVGSLHFDPDIDAAALRAAHQSWAERYARPALAPRCFVNDGEPERPLRIGYVSPDFRSHAVAYFVEPILAHHDPTGFECYAYAEVCAPDAVTARLHSLARHWRLTVGWSDDELAACIRADGIDILVDLAGHTGHNRLLTFARKPAPVQVSYLGYPGSTGLSDIDYRLTDAIADPPNEPECASETLLRLPGSFCCYQPPRDAPAVRLDLPSRSAGVVTFGALHKLEKLNDAVVDVWCALLRDQPDSRLLLGRNTLHGTTARYWTEVFTRRGIDPARLILRRLEAAAHAHRTAYHEIDIALDAFPWNGHATACEALWMGVPVVTLGGSRHAGRMVASVLTALGLTDLIAATPEEYRHRVLTLAADINGRAELRANLRGRLRSSRLCDGATFTRGLEAAYRLVWRGWCAGLTPAAGSAHSI